MPMKTFGEQLREARKERGVTQEQLARRADITLTTLQRMETDKHDPSLVTLRKIAAEFPHQALTFPQGSYEVSVVAKRRKT